MNSRRQLFTLSTTLLLTVAATAQSRNHPTSYLNRGGSNNATIGSSDLGGTTHAHSLLATASSSLGNSATMSLGTAATVNMLGQTGNASMVTADLSSSTSPFFPPQRSGVFRVQMNGIDLVNQNFGTDTTLPRQTRIHAVAFSANPYLAFWLGPAPIRLFGTATTTLTTSLSFLLPTGDTAVSAGGYVQSSGHADAELAVFFSLGTSGIHLDGQIFDQSLTVLGGASTSTGSWGTAFYSLAPISLAFSVSYRLVFYYERVLLAAWAQAAVNRVFF